MQGTNFSHTIDKGIQKTHVHQQQIAVEQKGRLNRTWAVLFKRLLVFEALATCRILCSNTCNISQGTNKKLQRNCIQS